MKNYEISFDEAKKIIIEANNEDEARNKFHDFEWLEKDAESVSIEVYSVDEI